MDWHDAARIFSLTVWNAECPLFDKNVLRPKLAEFADPAACQETKAHKIEQHGSVAFVCDANYDCRLTTIGMAGST